LLRPAAWRTVGTANLQHGPDQPAQPERSAIRSRPALRDLVRDADLRVKGCVGTLINALFPGLRKLGYTDFLQGNQKVMLGDLEFASESATANPDGLLDQLVISRSEQLAAWAAECGTTDYHPGAPSGCWTPVIAPLRGASGP
jgi:hypothetical protein